MLEYPHIPRDQHGRQLEVHEHGTGPHPAAEGSLPRPFKTYLRLIAVLFGTSLLALLRVHLQGRPLKFAHQWTDPNDIYGDFWHYRALLEHLHRPEFFTSADRFAYPAPCAILLQALYHLGPHPHVSFNLLLWTIEAISALLFCRFLLRSGIKVHSAVGATLLMLVTSFPWFILYIRGNIEVFVYAMTALGVWAWTRQHNNLAAMCWGCAASFKVYPLLLLMLYAQRTRWRAFGTGVLTFLVCLLAAFWYVGPSISVAARGSLNGITGFTGTYAVHARRDELWLDHSLLGGMKEILSFPYLLLGENWNNLNHFYDLLVLLALPALYVLFFRKLLQVNQLCLLLTGMMLLPPVSYDYTLVYSYVVLSLVLASILRRPRSDTAPRRFQLLFVCFALLSSSESWLRPAGLEFNCLLKCGALITIAVLLFRFPLEWDDQWGRTRTTEALFREDTHTHAHSTHPAHLA